MSEGRMPTASRGLRWLLLASLAANLVLAVVLTNVLLHPPRVWEPIMPSPRALGRALPEQHQPMFEGVLAEHRPHLREALRDRRQTRRQVRELLLADPFPRDQLEARLAELRQGDGSVSAAAHALLLDTFEQLSAADRAQLVEALYSHHRRHGESRRERRDGERETRRRPVIEAAADDAVPAAEAAEDQGD